MTASTDRPVLRAAGSHLYPGALVRLHASGTIAPHHLPTEPGELQLADGSRAPAQVLIDADERVTLWVGAYRTEAGTDICERVWSAHPAPDGEGAVLLRVVARLP